jgi:hypothetical protein
MVLQLESTNHRIKGHDVFGWDPDDDVPNAKGTLHERSAVFDA